MIGRPRTRDSYKEMTEALKPLGFTPHNAIPGRYYHKHMPGKLFDFTAHSLEGVAVAVFNAGEEAGRMEESAASTKHSRNQ